MAALWMLGTITSFCLMAIVIRLLGNDFSVMQMLFIRSCIGLAVISFIIFKLNPQLFKTEKASVQFFRNIFHFFGQYGWYLGITLLPLSQVFAIEFTVPIWTLLAAWLFLKESITPTKIMAISLGFVGVLIIVQPNFTTLDPIMLIVLAAAICYGIAHTCTKALSTTESTLTILFYMCVIQLPISLVFMMEQWMWPNLLEWLGFLLIGLTALTAHFCMIKAMAHGEITHIVILDFLRLPMIALVGAVFFQEPLALPLFVGGLLMLWGNWMMTKKVR